MVCDLPFRSGNPASGIRYKILRDLKMDRKPGHSKVPGRVYLSEELRREWRRNLMPISSSSRVHSFGAYFLNIEPLVGFVSAAENHSDLIHETGWTHQTIPGC